MQQAIPRMPSLPDMHPYQQHSLPRPVSAESNFSAAASSPSTHMTQAGRSDRQGNFKPGSMRLITTGLRTSAALADPSLAGQVSLTARLCKSRLSKACLEPSQLVSLAP